MTTAPAPARLRLGDLAGLASVGLRTRKLRAVLSALGIAIGVAAIVAVLGLASSSQAGLLAQIARLGTNLLTVTNGPNTYSWLTRSVILARTIVGSTKQPLARSSRSGALPPRSISPPCSRATPAKCSTRS